MSLSKLAEHPTGQTASWVALGGGSGSPGLLLVGGRCWASWGVMLGLLGGSCSNMEFLSSTQRNGAVASVLGP